MMTKREFAEEIVRDFCEEHNIKREDAYAHIYSSSRLAVALEFLGELSGIELKIIQQNEWNGISSYCL